MGVLTYNEWRAAWLQGMRAWLGAGARMRSDSAPDASQGAGKRVGKGKKKAKSAPKKAKKREKKKP